MLLAAWALVSAMMQSNDTNDPSPNWQKTLIVSRIIWAAIILGQLVFLTLVLLVLLPNAKTAPIDPAVGRTLTMLGFALAVLGVIVGIGLRALLFRQITPEGAGARQRFTTGTILLLACCEGPAFFGIIAMLLTHSRWPQALIVAIPLVVQFVSFPRMPAVLTSQRDT